MVLECFDEILCFICLVHVRWDNLEFKFIATCLFFDYGEALIVHYVDFWVNAYVLKCMYNFVAEKNYQMLLCSSIILP